MPQAWSGVLFWGLSTQGCFTGHLSTSSHHNIPVTTVLSDGVCVSSWVLPMNQALNWNFLSPPCSSPVLWYHGVYFRVLPTQNRGRWRERTRFYGSPRKAWIARPLSFPNQCRLWVQGEVGQSGEKGSPQQPGSWQLALKLWAVLNAQNLEKMAAHWADSWEAWIRLSKMTAMTRPLIKCDIVIMEKGLEVPLWGLRFDPKVK